MDTLLERTVAAAGLGALFYGVRLVFERRGAGDALGLGDVKLAAAIGLVLGPTLALTAVMSASIGTLIATAAPVLLSRSAALSRGAPFGIGLATALGIFAVLHIALIL
jgi:leader peptidase (prepilin peptidase)/N-methyltransferase